jgi:hypothetical protein
MKPMIGKNMKQLITLYLLIVSSLSYAKVTATVDRNQIVIGETFNLTITVDENTAEQPDLSELNEVFQVLGTSQSSSTKIINGQYSVEKSWQISLMPNGVGRNTIPPIKLGTETTRAIPVVVTKSDPNAKANGDIFIEISTDKSNAFVKEQIILTVKLFYSISLSEGNLSEPIASNAIITQLDKGANYSTNRDGRNYTVIERHYALFAEKSGQLSLNPIIFNGRDNSSRRSFSMFSTGKPVRAVSKPLNFEIKPIPQQSIGKDWLPATKVQISQQWSKGPFKVGEPITRTITLYVEGLNDTQIPDINLGEIEDVRIYPEQPQTQTETTTQSVKSYKQVKIALIPTHAGAIRIPEYQLEWFNTKTGQVEQAKLPPVTIQVEAGEFAMQAPNTQDLINPKKAHSAKTKDVDENQETQQPQVKIIEKEGVLWKILTAVFALLWLLMLYLYWKKPTAKKAQHDKPKPIVVSKNQIISAINNKNLKQLESKLISWWNQQYPPHQVTNLSQIKQMVEQPMAQLIDVVELQLYNPQAQTRFNQDLWLKQIKGNGLKITVSSKIDKASELPKLYN